MIIAGTHSCLHGAHCPAGKCTTHYIVLMVDVPHTNPFFNTFVIVKILSSPPPPPHTHFFLLSLFIVFILMENYHVLIWQFFITVAFLVLILCTQKMCFDIMPYQWARSSPLFKRTHCVLFLGQACQDE